jgi:N-acetyl-anhydromuramyl-L-alanine amidase AmpD
VLFDDTFRKDRRHPPGHGYGRQVRKDVWVAERPGAGRPSAVIVHATHGKPGTLSTSEAAFLRNSPHVSAHYLIARDGRIFRILPDHMVGWHAGVCLVGFGNLPSIGIEIHAATTEAILPVQREALGALVRHLALSYGIPAARVQTHRAVARPAGRKSDPATWPQVEFEVRRAGLYRELTAPA